MKKEALALTTMLKGFGKHKLICVTYRTEEYDNSDMEWVLDLMPVYYTDRRAKMKYLEDLDIFPDVWVDDDPSTILYDIEERRNLI